MVKSCALCCRCKVIKVDIETKRMSSTLRRTVIFTKNCSSESMMKGGAIKQTGRVVSSLTLGQREVIFSLCGVVASE